MLALNNENNLKIIGNFNCHFVVVLIVADHRREKLEMRNLNDLSQFTVNFFNIISARFGLKIPHTHGCANFFAAFSMDILPNLIKCT